MFLIPYVKLDANLLQFMCNMTSDVRFWNMLFFLFTLFLSTIKMFKSIILRVKELWLLNKYWNKVKTSKGWTEIKQWKNIFTYIHSQENARDSVFFSTVAVLRVYRFTENFLWNLWRFTKSHFYRRQLRDSFWFSATFRTYHFFYLK